MRSQSVGIIPARGNSKRIERKNLKLLHGKPLVVHTILAAIESDLDLVVLSSEDDEVISESMKHVQAEYGQSPDKFFAIVRPEELSQDHVQNDSVMLHVLYQLQHIGINVGAGVLLQPTSPFRTSRDINKAFEIYANNKPCTIVSGAYSDSFYWTPDFDSNKWGYVEATPIGIPPKFRPGTQWVQKSEKLFEEDGAIYITDAAKMLVTKTRYNPPFLIYEMDKSIDIDTVADWTMAEQVAA
jgi:CMP-N-acetylneuraminic acid synthetase